MIYAIISKAGFHLSLATSATHVNRDRSGCRSN